MMFSKITTALSIALLLSSCTLPADGPTNSKIAAADQTQVQADLPPVNLVVVDQQTVQQLSLAQRNQSFASLVQPLAGANAAYQAANSGAIIDANGKQLSTPASITTASYSNTSHDLGVNYQGQVGAGDLISISIWETAPAMLFTNSSAITSEGSSRVNIPTQMVNVQGQITVPFVGQINVSGLTPVQIQQRVTNALRRIANNPQVLVQVDQNNSANVTVLRKGNSTRMPLTAHQERVLDAVTAVGGVDAQARDISVQLTRNGQVKTISLLQLVTDPQQNIKLQAGDIVYLIDNPLSFVALGAVNQSSEIKFSAAGLSLAQGLARMGGLVDERADPTGIYVFRNVPLTALTPQAQQAWLDKGYTRDMSIPTVYQVNLNSPCALFWLQKFPLQDQDLVYVANASSNQLRKFLSLVYAFTNPIYNIVRTKNYIDDWDE
ncbi:polysaccharide biosynthesis/export family protein [Psittacicella hinzii]|uniref:Polysaccharide export outer membrane protein n=1 Tax=Psittacicella hinzii TaxID=2028575 RepID=A0A3A1YP15_9GAMM|nr:polysaccharide biosynthesis/export family protein [Psittacicella hinzii]RIY38700.1 hypothetical protein CKF58_03610 [Psittacicella hinzii]